MIFFWTIFAFLGGFLGGVLFMFWLYRAAYKAASAGLDSALRHMKQARHLQMEAIRRAKE